MSVYRVFLADEAAMVSLGQQLAQATQGCGVVFLQGNLGMGKTTLSRGVIRAFGHTGAVKSPTYTLVEPYELEADKKVYHFDLYRLSDPEELEYLGIRDYFDENALCLIEWPDKGAGVLPEPDLTLNLSLSGQGREAEFVAHNARGQEILSGLQQ